MKRQLIDRIEEYSYIVHGKCSCGELVDKVVNSNCTSLSNGDRYHYPGSNTAWSIFRCKNCGYPIINTFEPLKNETNLDKKPSLTLGVIGIILTLGIIVGLVKLVFLYFISAI